MMSKQKQMASKKGHRTRLNKMAEKMMFGRKDY